MGVRMEAQEGRAERKEGGESVSDTSKILYAGYILPAIEDGW